MTTKSKNCLRRQKWWRTTQMNKIYKGCPCKHWTHKRTKIRVTETLYGSSVVCKAAYCDESMERLFTAAVRHFTSATVKSYTPITVALRNPEHIQGMKSESRFHWDFTQVWFQSESKQARNSKEQYLGFIMPDNDFKLEIKLRIALTTEVLCSWTPGAIKTKLLRSPISDHI